MTQSGWVKPDFGSGFLKTQSSTRNPTSIKTNLHESNRKKCKSENLEFNQNAMFTAPVSSSELVVQKKKIAEVKHWLDQAFSSAQQSQFLLITGPPGCGKQQTLNVLCKEMHVDVLCWEEPVKHFGVQEWDQHGQQYSSSSPFYNKQTDQNFFDHLEEFFERANRYCSLKIRETGSKVSNNGQTANKKLLLLKDFPPMIFKNLERWHNLLLKYSCKGRTPAVFIITDSNSYNSVQLKLFPPHLQEKLVMSTTIFGGLANTFLLKALQRVVQKQQNSISHEVIEGIVETCNGDLRSALNTIYWMGPSSSKVTKNKLPPPKKRKLTTDVKKESFEGNYIRDGSLDFMHAVGKVLHSKRLSTVDHSCELPSHLLDEFRLPLKENIDDLTQKIGETPSKVLLYLHQNYPLFFNRIEDVSKAIGYLSSADSFCSQLHQGNKETFEECALLTGIRGLMQSNTSVNGNSWRPIKKPEYYDVHQNQQNLCKEVQELWPNQSGLHFFSETLPFIRLIQPELKLPSGERKISLHIPGSRLQGHQFAMHQPYKPDGANETNKLKLPVSINDEDANLSTNEDEDIVVIEEFDD